MPRRAAGLLAFLAVAFAGTCASSAGASVARWRPFAAVHGVIDLAAPRGDGRLTLAVSGRLGLLRPGSPVSGFAPAYRDAGTGEPYIVRSPGQRVPGAGCAFRRDDVFALDTRSVRPGVVRVDAAGRMHRAGELPATVFPNGIAFDAVGAFGHRLLVTGQVRRGVAALYGVDCRGRRRTIAAAMPIVEGGMVVAPHGFGRFGGRLIAPDELSGRVMAVNGRGRAAVLARSGLPTGGDIGVESLGFVPRGFERGTTALLADRAVPGAPHPGTDTILGVSGAALHRAGVRAGDLLAAAEGGGATLAIRCPRRGACSVRLVARAPAVTHAEGHIVFARTR